MTAPYKQIITIDFAKTSTIEYITNKGEVHAKVGVSRQGFW
jgi:hypothetical protein